MLAIASASFLLFLTRLYKKPKSSLFIFTGFLLAGLCWGCLSLLNDARQVELDETWLESVVEFKAEVVQIQQHGIYARLTLTDVQRDDGARLNGKVWLYNYARKQADGAISTSHKQSRFLSGDLIQAKAKLHLPRNHRNPSGFDFESYCFDRHIALLGSARGEVRLISPGASWLEHVRQRIRHVLSSFSAEQQGVLRALLLGERYDIPENVYDVFAATGAAHLLAISGLHVGMVATLGFALFWFLLTRREAWIVGVPVRGLSLLGGVLLALTYAALAGWPLPTQRAAMMLVAAALAWWLRSHASPVNTLLAALMLILLLDPDALGSLSLWLSFVATAGILLWAKGSVESDGSILSRWALGLLLVTLVAALVTLPLVAHVFGRLPTYGLPANVLMTPLYTMLILPSSLLAALLAAIGLEGFSHVLFGFAGSAIELGDEILALICAWPVGHIWLPGIPFWLSLIYVGGMGLALLLFYRQRRCLAAGLLLLTLATYGWAVSIERPSDDTRFIAWDIGQGAAASLHLPAGKVMVIDAAGRPGSRFNAGTILAEGLRGMGLVHVDVLLISHAQSDHFGGAFSLLRRLNRIGELWLADVPEMRQSKYIARLRRETKQKGGMVRWLKQGDKVSFASTQGKVLWPPKDYAPANNNNTSLVLRLELPAGQRLLLAGDIEAEVERELVTSLAQHELDSDVMLIPHHGSATSSTAKFLAAVSPGLAIAQTGYANRYGFPALKIQRRYAELGATVLDTAQGAVMVDFDQQGGAREQVTPPVFSPKRNVALQWWQGMF